MKDKESVIITGNSPVEIIEYENGSVAFVHPDIPNWIRSSLTGLWIYNFLKEHPTTLTKMIETAAAHYNLESEVIEKPVKSFVNEMILHGFLVQQYHAGAETAAEPGNVRILSESPLEQFVVAITSACNGTSRYRDTKNHISVNDLETLFIQARDIGIRELVITGGEPLLHPEFQTVMELARNASDWTIKVVTEGSKDNSAMYDALIRNADVILITVDGTTPDVNDGIRGDGAFSNAMGLLEYVFHHESRDTTAVGISFTPLPQNMPQILSLGDFGYKLGVDFLQINQLRLPTRLVEEKAGFTSGELDNLFRESYVLYNELTATLWNDFQSIKKRGGMNPIAINQTYAVSYDLYDRIKKRNCGAGITTLFITEEGECYPCFSLQDIPEAHIGSWRQEKDLLKMAVVARKWNETVFSVDNHQNCKQCEFRYFCGGGCRARANVLSENDSLCETIKNIYHEFNQYAGVVVQKRSEEDKAYLLKKAGSANRQPIRREEVSIVRLKSCI